ncbi:unnamed protein product, partial [Tilletia caries]
LSVVEYQTAILRGDLEAASTMLENVPLDQRNKLARFLETQDHKELALQVTQDPDRKFDLAVSLDDFDTALEIAQTGPQTGSEPRWRTIGDKAIGRWNLSLAQECFEKAKDLNALLLLGISAGDRTLLSRVATQSSTSREMISPFKIFSDHFLRILILTVQTTILKIGTLDCGLRSYLKTGRMPYCGGSEKVPL